ERETLRLQREREQASQMERTIADLSDSLQRRIIRTQTQQQVENIERLNGLTKTLADVEKGIENEIANYQKQVANLTRTNEQREQDRLNYEIEARVLTAKLDAVQRNLNALSAKAGEGDAIVAEVADAHELRLVPEAGIQIACDRSADTMIPQLLNLKGG